MQLLMKLFVHAIVGSWCVGNCWCITE